MWARLFLELQLSAPAFCCGCGSWLSWTHEAFTCHYTVAILDMSRPKLKSRPYFTEILRTRTRSEFIIAGQVPASLWAGTAKLCTTLVIGPENPGLTESILAIPSSQQRRVESVSATHRKPALIAFGDAVDRTLILRLADKLTRTLDLS